MRRIWATALAVLWAGSAGADPLTLPQYLAGMKLGKPDAKVAYGLAPQQTAEVYSPKGSGPFPVVVMLHGGCYSNEVPAASLSAPAADLAAHGAFVWNVEYRRVGDPGGGYPGMYQDVGAAIDRLREEAGPRHLDLSRVVLVGHSSGGLLALWAAARAKLPTASPLRSADPLKVRAVVSLASMGDLKGFSPLLPWICGDDLKVEQVVGVKSAERPDPFADISPRALLPLGVPTLSLTGEYDAQLPPYMAFYWRLAAEKKGDKAEVRVLRDAGHFDLVAVQTPAWIEVREAILKVVADLQPRP
jgi:acetyl esterase/lipase